MVEKNSNIQKPKYLSGRSEILQRTWRIWKIQGSGVFWSKLQTLIIMIPNYLCNRFEAQLEWVSKELNHFGVIAGLFRQIGGHSSRFVLFCSFWRLFTIKMIKSVKVFPFSFLKIITNFFFYFIKFKPPA